MTAPSGAPPTVVLDEEALRERVDALAREISADHPDGVVLIAVLKGALIFLADLVRRMRVDVAVDFLAISRYAPDSGRVRILKDLDLDVTDRDVVIVEDLVDTGLTLAYLVQHIAERGARRIETCALLDRRERRIVPLPVRYVGLELPGDAYVLGYGLHAGDRYRNLAFIVRADPEALRADPDALLGLYAQLRARDLDTTRGRMLALPVAIVNPGQSPAAVEKALVAELDRMKTEGVTERELQRSKNQFARDYILGRETVQQKATILAHAEVLHVPSPAQSAFARHGADVFLVGRIDAVAPLARLVVQILPVGERASGQKVVFDEVERPLDTGRTVGVADLVGHEAEGAVPHRLLVPGALPQPLRRDGVQQVPRQDGQVGEDVGDDLARDQALEEIDRVARDADRLGDALLLPLDRLVDRPVDVVGVLVFFAVGRLQGPIAVQFGAGQVGGTLAASLVAENNDLTVVDMDRQRLAELQDRFDLRTVQGHAAHPSILQKAGAADADMVVAVTQSDETNLVACKLCASEFNVPTRVARIRSPDYLAQDEEDGETLARKHFAVDHTISPEQEITHYLRRLVEHPEALQVLDFADGSAATMSISMSQEV